MTVDLQKLARALVDNGKLVEGGWVALRSMAISPDAPQDQLDEMRNAFFAGAQHMFGSIMSILDPGDEPTEKDLQRMDLIQRELDEFIAEFKLRYIREEGTS